MTDDILTLARYLAQNTMRGHLISYEHGFTVGLADEPAMADMAVLQGIIDTADRLIRAIDVYRSEQAQVRAMLRETVPA